MAMNQLEITVKAEYTPNPNSLKFICNQTLLPVGSLTYANAEEAKDNPMASKLFKTAGVVKVFFMSNFATIDKTDETNWKDIHIEIKDTIKDELNNLKEWAETNGPQDTPRASSGDASYDQKVQRIEEVLDKLRPALVADGGNIELVDLVEKDARLRMVGACGSCPSSLMTMKMGVERALVAEVPDIVESVTQVY